MKKIILVCIIGFSFYYIKAQHLSPSKVLSDSLSKLKKAGKLNGDEWFYNPNATKELHITNPNKNSSRKGKPNQIMSSTACNCWIPRDGTFSVVPFDGSGGSGGPGVPPTYANDDWSTAGITLPFNFCFYGAPAGTSSNQLYINNNGNISFGAPYSIFSAVPFPSSAYVMIAPFWGDVETDQVGSGFVYYQLTPTHLIVQWDSVYYYGEEGNNTLINTFQLIITNGTDSILPPGNNISFCYGEMQWTTGYASGGSLGFGGTPATVGLNKGDGTTFTQIGLFGNSGSTYAGSTGTSGVGWLAGQSFYFNSCGVGGSLPPVVTSGGPPSTCSGDTLTICSAGNVLAHTVSFIPPSTTGTVSAVATAPGLGPNFSVTSSTSGTSASLTFQVNSTGLAAGYYTVTVTATNNAALSTTLNYIIHVINGTSFPAPVLVANPSVTCGSTPAVVTLANSSAYSSWVWSTGTSSPTNTISVATTSTVQVTVSQAGCTNTGSVAVQFYSVPHPVIGGALTYCPPSTSTALYVNTPISGGTAPYSYSWNSGFGIHDTLTATGSSTGTGYTVVVTDTHGCKDSTSVTVTSGSVTPLNITSAGSLCAGHDTLFSSITTASGYTWSPGAGSSTSTYVIGSTPGTYTLALTINNCPVTQTITISPPITPTLSVLGNTVICAGTKTTLTVAATPTASAGYTYSWFNGATPIGNTDTLTFNATGNAYFVTAVNNNTQCKGIQTFTIIPATNPIFDSISGALTYCKGVGDTLTAYLSGGAPPYTYSWSPGAITTQSIVATPTVSLLVYTVTVTDSKGCIATKTEPLKQSNPHLVLPNQYICPGSIASFHAHGSGTNPLTYLWLPSTAGATYTTSVPGTYTVVMTDKYKCHDTVHVSVIQYPKPLASFTYSPSPATQSSPVTFTDNSTIASPDSIKWDMWTFGDGDTVIANTNAIHTYANGGTYMVTLVVASEFGCMDTVTKVIEVQYNIIAPNIITPNGDGINEFLAFKNLQYFNNNKIWIYNRWGSQLYHNADYKNDWTGKDYSDGTYFYILEVPDKNQTLKGFFENIK